MENSMEGVFHNQPAQAPNDTVQFILPKAFVLARLPFSPFGRDAEGREGRRFAGDQFIFPQPFSIKSLTFS